MYLGEKRIDANTFEVIQIIQIMQMADEMMTMVRYFTYLSIVVVRMYLLRG